MSQSPPPAPAAAAGKSALELARERLACLTEKHKFTEAKLNAAIKERELQLDKLLEQDFKVGERLKARFQTGNPKSFYDCELVAINPNGTFKVKYTEKRRDSDEKGPTVNEVCEQLPCARKSVNPPKGSSYPRFSWIKRGNAKRGRKSNKRALDRLMGELKELRNGDMPRLVERKRQEAESKERRNLEKQIKQMSGDVDHHLGAQAAPVGRPRRQRTYADEEQDPSVPHLAEEEDDEFKAERPEHIQAAVQKFYEEKRAAMPNMSAQERAHAKWTRPVDRSGSFFKERERRIELLLEDPQRQYPKRVKQTPCPHHGFECVVIQNGWVPQCNVSHVF